MLIILNKTRLTDRAPERGENNNINTGLYALRSDQDFVFSVKFEGWPVIVTLYFGLKMWEAQESHPSTADQLWLPVHFLKQSESHATHTLLHQFSLCNQFRTLCKCFFGEKWPWREKNIYVVGGHYICLAAPAPDWNITQAT